jgi:hypothetical protein
MCNENDIFNSTNVVALSSAIVGAFFGSASAFLLGRFQQKRDLHDKRYGTLIATQFALLSQWNTLEGIRHKHLEPLRNDPERVAKLGLFYTPKSYFPVPFSDIPFLANLGEPNLLQEVQIAEQSYISAMETLELRNRLVEDFNKSEYVKKSVFDKSTVAFHVQAPIHDMHIIEQAVAALYQQIDGAIPKLKQQTEKVYDFIKQNFKMKAIKMTPKN